jgi:hypothetical protein
MSTTNLNDYVTASPVTPTGQSDSSGWLENTVAKNPRICGIVIIGLIITIVVIIVCLYGIGGFGPFIAPAAKAGAATVTPTKPAPPDAETESLIDAINKA